MPKDAPVDPRGPRFSAWMTTVVLAVVLLTGWWRLLAAQTVLFALCAFVSLRLNPWGHAVPARDPAEAHADHRARGSRATAVRAGRRLRVRAGRHDRLRHRRSPRSAWSRPSAALVAAFLNAAFGLCLGLRDVPAPPSIRTRTRTSPAESNAE